VRREFAAGLRSRRANAGAQARLRESRVAGNEKRATRHAFFFGRIGDYISTENS
jgi:hypothetical protein